MWSETLKILNPYEALAKAPKKLEKRKGKKGGSTMYINPFICGVAATILAEVILVIIVAIFKSK